ncbi:MAG: gliding motility-associated ABC transporter substrate-binding protein GldG [Flavobacteriia bacterium]|nr:MAG: gliding motility-associated ABC transporter substrate-binding protein GldG [Flavobacteriia bacterium]
MKKNTSILNILLVLAGIIVLNFLGNKFYKRFDLTQDHRYTLSEETVYLVDQISDPMSIKVYLEGDFPAEFNRIQTETRQHLEELQALNNNINFRFINPKTKTKELIKAGLQPSRLSVQEDGHVSQAVIFPWAVINYKGKTEKVSLLSNAVAASQEEQLQNSIENLEYAFSNGLQKIISGKKKKIAVIRGNGELKDIYLFSALKKLGEYYRLAEFTLDSVKKSPQKTLKELTGYDMAIIAKPTERFTDKEKFTLDQFITNGGKILWMIDKVYADIDSLMTTGKMLAFNRDLNLTDQLFRYGVRINYNITKDLYCSTIRLASGNTGNQTQYQDFPWLYYPLIITNNNNPITAHIDPVRLRFPSTMDTLSNGIKKTILLKSSPYARPIGTPVEVSLEEVSQKPTKKYLNKGNQIFGVLLEGEFTSAFADRIQPFKSELARKKSPANKMIVISDGDVIANEVFRGEPLELEKDTWTNLPYGNLDLIMNSAQYLMDDSGILNLRAKKLKIRFLDKEKAYSERQFWQMLNLIFPVLILILFGFIFNFLRKRKYTS